MDFWPHFSVLNCLSQQWHFALPLSCIHPPTHQVGGRQTLVFFSLLFFFFFFIYIYIYILFFLSLWSFLSVFCSFPSVAPTFDMELNALFNIHDNTICVKFHSCVRLLHCALCDDKRKTLSLMNCCRNLWQRIALGKNPDQGGEGGIGEPGGREGAGYDPITHSLKEYPDLNVPLLHQPAVGSKDWSRIILNWWRCGRRSQLVEFQKNPAGIWKESPTYEINEADASSSVTRNSFLNWYALLLVKTFVGLLSFMNIFIYIFFLHFILSGVSVFFPLCVFAVLVLSPRPPAVLNWFSWWTNLSSWNVKHGQAGPHKITNLFFWSGRFLEGEDSFFLSFSLSLSVSLSLSLLNRNRIAVLLTEVTFFTVSHLGSLLNVTICSTSCHHSFPCVRVSNRN